MSVFEPATAETIVSVIRGLKKESYVFSVAIESLGDPWDIYRFEFDGRAGTAAVRIVNGEAELGLFEEGSPDESEVAVKLLEVQLPVTPAAVT